MIRIVMNLKRRPAPVTVAEDGECSATRAPCQMSNGISAQVARIGLYVAILLLSAGCAVTNAGLSPILENPSDFVVPLAFTDGLGVGAGAVEGAFEIGKDDVNKAASRAIVLALQELEISIQEPPLKAGELLPQRRKWVSDRAPVTASRIRDHNVSHPEMKLSEQFNYQIAYLGEYVVERNELIFRVSAQLYESAAAAGQREYKQPYSGRFFVDVLGKLIQSKLRGAAAGGKP